MSILLRTGMAKDRWQWTGYKRVQLPHEVARRGDLAVVTDDCCTQYTGLEVKVVGDPHFTMNLCPSCGSKLLENFVEVEPQQREKPLFKEYAGPFFMPVSWLRRIDPKT